MNTKNSEMTLACLAVTGIDAKRFLQGQVTCNVEEVSETEFKLGAHCNPQGRVISFFRLFGTPENYFLLMPQDLIDVTINALKKYAIFFKVAMTETPCPETIPLENFTLPLDIQAGIPQIYATTSGKFLPHEINLQLINALSFDKGCYTGQEIIARMHYRGQLKTHMYRARANTERLPAANEDLFYEQNPAGNIVAACKTSQGIEFLFIANKNVVETKQFYLQDNIPVDLLTLPYSFS